MAKLTASQQQDITNNFLHKLGARARITDRTYSEPVFDPYKFTSFGEPPSSYYAKVVRHPIVEVEMPLNKFEQLADTMNDIEELQNRYGPNIHEMAMSAIRAEHAFSREFMLRREYPALQKAWDNYQLVLKMVEGKND